MKIEQYIKDNKDELDVHEPDVSKMWGTVHHELQKKKEKRIQLIKWAAASLLVFFTIGALVRHEIVVQRQITSLSQINSDLANKEADYKNQIDSKWSQFTSIKTGESPIEPMLMNELKLLDTIYSKGLEEFKNTAYNERAVIILLETYEKRLRIIEQLIYEKQKQKNYENKNIQVEI
jgi:hypothetical protein